MVIVLILVRVTTGIAIVTEAIAVAAAYPLCFTVPVYRSMARTRFYRTLAYAVKITGVVLLLIVISSMPCFQMAYPEIPDAIEQILTQASAVPWLVLLRINIP